MLLVLISKLIFIFLCFCQVHAAESKIDYWNTQRKGANFFNQTPHKEWFIAANKINIQFARVAPDKWKCEKKDFLIGDADSFTTISTHDLEDLKNILNQALQNNVKIVLTFLSLPGSRWKQNNHDKDDLRLWKEKKYREQALLFWKNLAKELKDHPALVGYNILNEPHPERLFGFSDYRKIDFQTWYESIKSSLADLNLFYKDMVEAIREVDLETPIIIDTGLYATPWAINYLTPIEDDKIIYSFHMYEPYAYTTRKINDGRFAYPGHIPIEQAEAEDENLSKKIISIFWNDETLEQFFHPVLAWQKKHQISSSRILVGEFGCDRTANGAKEYLFNLINIFNTNQWHWAFYSFREDCWDSMDYELGDGNLPWEYWETSAKDNTLDKFRLNNPLFDVIKNNLKITP